ncbi:hypothetical protein CALCODRAFT_137108 [Calocera cornea HHB12733]|uniref:Uncharacterized protein n=1 Tax=Calocera cornea HHB12733 TaxID=1353952 RepID=A0A165CTW8_9BASI|nr:hypothetical protein CALCODRAFT_137108 [Calocera cornea HHB12733]
MHRLPLIRAAINVVTQGVHRATKCTQYIRTTTRPGAQALCSRKIPRRLRGAARSEPRRARAAHLAPRAPVPKSTRSSTRQEAWGEVECWFLGRNGLGGEGMREFDQVVRSQGRVAIQFCTLRFSSVPGFMRMQGAAEDTYCTCIKADARGNNLQQAGKEGGGAMCGKWWEDGEVGEEEEAGSRIASGVRSLGEEGLPLARVLTKSTAAHDAYDA